jgi:fructose-specific phosphotransferase system IIC component
VKELHYKSLGSYISKGITSAIPFIIIYSVLLAIGNTSSEILKNISSVSDEMFIVVLIAITLFISNQMVSKFTIIPSILIGVYLSSFSVGFLGAIIAGLLVGVVAHMLCTVNPFSNEKMNLIYGYVVIGMIAFFFTYIVMRFVFIPPIDFLLSSLNDYIFGINLEYKILVVGLLAFLTAVDLGGPFNKLAFGIVITFYFEGYYFITGPALIAVTVPPLSVFLALIIMPHRFEEVDLKNKRFAGFSSLIGLTEGALAVAFRRPLKVLLPVVVGSFSGAIFAAIFDLENTLIAGSLIGLFTASNIFIYVSAHLIGAAVSILLIFFMTLKKSQLQE